MKENNYELIRRIYRKETVLKYQHKAKLLGRTDSSNIICFLNTRLCLSFLIFLYILLTSDFNYLISTIITLVFYFGFSYFYYDYRIKKRAFKLEKESIFFFDVLVLALESGKNLIQSLNVAIDNVDGELSLEFKKTLKEMEYGKSLKDSFQDLRKRIPADSIQNVILNITDSYTTGGNIISTLKKQIDYIRNKRAMDIKATINQMPIKISVVSVFLFIPIVLLILLAPVILEYIG